MQLVVFRLCRAEYAVLIDKVREVIDHPPVAGLPGTPSGFDGAVNVRGRLVPVIDFAARMGLPESARSGRQIVIVETGGTDIGLTVDTVTEVIRTAAANFANMEATEAVGYVFRKVCTFHDRVIMLLDVEKVLADMSVAV